MSGRDSQTEAVVSRKGQSPLGLLESPPPWKVVDGRSKSG